MCLLWLVIPEIEKNDDGQKEESQWDGVTWYVDLVDVDVPLKQQNEEKVICKTH